MQKLIQWLKRRRLRIAQEKHASWKAESEARLMLLKSMPSGQWEQGRYIRAKAKEALYNERVETAMKEICS